jgi:uncharacterized protein YegJ (DUF2314 family)
MATAFPFRFATAAAHASGARGSSSFGAGRAIFKVCLSLAVLLLALSRSGIALADDPNPVPKVPKGDPAMTAAFARARIGLEGFLLRWSKPPPGADRFAVKIGLMDAPGVPGYVIVPPLEDASANGRIEWFWVINLHSEGAGFSGQIGNDPEWLRNVSFGQAIHFARQDIGDWMYMQNGKIIGNATACPALAYDSAEERRQMKERFGLACD